MSPKDKALVRSTVTSLVAVLAGLLAIDQVPGVELPTAVIALATTLIGCGRSIIAWVDKGNTSFGRGS